MTYVEAREATRFDVQTTLVSCMPPGVAPDEDASDSRAEMRPSGRKPIGLVTLVILIFYNVSGGPFGSEEAVGMGGPFWALLGFAVFPLIWSVPEALVTAELATAFPDDAGYVSWVTTAFGPFWGFQEGFLSWLCGTMDSAIYPALFVTYLDYAVCPKGLGGEPSDSCPVMHAQLAWCLPSARVFLVYALICALSYLNFRGLDAVGKVAIGMTVFVLLPFVVLCIAGLPHMRPSVWLPGGDGAPRQVNWVTWLNTLFWNLNYWDTASTVAGEVSEPERTFPRALAWAVVLVAGTYVVPLAICTAALPPGQAWGEGFFAEAAYMLGGRGLQLWILASAAVSNAGQFLSEQAANSHQLLGMAELGHLPRCFAARSKHGTPTLGLLLGLTAVLPIAMCSLDSLVEMLNGVYCLAELLEFAAFLQLRRRHPHLHRPYKVPLGFAGCVLLLTAPTLMCLLLLVLPLIPSMGHPPTTALFTGGSALVGLLLYGMLALFRRLRPQSFLQPPSPPVATEALDVLGADTLLGEAS